MYARSAEGEARRLAGLRSPQARAKMSATKKGRAPKNFQSAQALAWTANRKGELTYSGIHAWVRRTWGKATKCERCGKDGLARHSVHWANLDHAYTRERSAWMQMCRPCHFRHDAENNGSEFFGLK